MKINIRAEIINGEIFYYDLEDRNNFIKKNEGKKLIETMDSNRQRTLDQNSYYWGVAIKILSDETGYTPEDIHEILKWELLPRKFIKSPDGSKEIEIAKSTRKLNTKQFGEYLEGVWRIAAEQGIEIEPPPRKQSLNKE